MMRSRTGQLGLALAVVAGAGGLLAGCSDDGAGVRSASASGSGSGSLGSGSVGGSASGAGSGSGSGLANEDVGAGTTDRQVRAAISRYRAYVLREADALRGDTKEFTDAVRAGDLAEAKAEYAPSRVRWERIEPVAGLVEEIDGKVDARVDDFAGVNDPEFTGWHRMEYLLWEQRDVDAAARFADQLDADIVTLGTQLRRIDVPPSAVALGAAELIEEVSKGKITGEEDRYSHTDLWDFAANVYGAERVLDSLAPVLSERDPELLATCRDQIDAVKDGLEPYRRGDEWAPYTELTAEDKDVLTVRLAALAESLTQIPAALGLR